MQTKCLSDVVTVVLFIAAAMLAVAILWNFISPTLTKAAINTAAYTSQFDVAEGSVTLDPNTNLVNLNIERKAGDGEVIGFLVGLEDPAGNIKTFRQNLTINELETKNIGVNYTTFPMDDVVGITVTPIFKNNQTQLEQIGQPISKTVPPQNKKFKLPSGLVAHWKMDESWVDSKGGVMLTQSGAGFDLNNKKAGSASAS